MKIRRIVLLRVSSAVDKEVEHPQFFDPPYPLKYMQSGLAGYPGIETQLIDCWIHPMHVREMLDETEKSNPELVVVSSSSFDIDVANTYAHAIKQTATPPLLIGVGQGFYLNPKGEKSIHSHYDAILLGEPEEEFFSLFDKILANDEADHSWRAYYQNHYNAGKRFKVKEPDKLAFPVYSKEELESYRSIFPVQFSKPVTWGYLIATRGCPHACVFCSEVMRVSVGAGIRARSVSNVADEMEHLAGMGVNICSFQDDSFSARRSFIEAFCRELISRKSGMPWMARARADELDYELLALMKKAGCIMLGIGVESGSLRITRQMHKHSKKIHWQEQCRKVFRWTRKLGIGTNAYYVIGNPTETEEEIKTTIRFAMELNSDSIQVHYYTPYPGSVAWNIYQDLLDGTNACKMYHYATPVVQLAGVSNEKLIKLRSQFYRRYILRPGFAFDHLKRHLAFYLRNRDILQALLGIRKVM